MDRELSRAARAIRGAGTEAAGTFIDALGEAGRRVLFCELARRVAAWELAEHVTFALLERCRVELPVEVVAALVTGPPEGCEARWLVLMEEGRSAVQETVRPRTATRAGGHQTVSWRRMRGQRRAPPGTYFEMRAADLLPRVDVESVDLRP